MPNIMVKGHLVQVFVCTHRDTHTHTTPEQLLYLHH